MDRFRQMIGRADEVAQLRQMIERGRRAEEALPLIESFLNELEGAAEDEVCQAAARARFRALLSSAHSLRAVRSLKRQLQEAAETVAGATVELDKIMQQGGENGGAFGPSESGTAGHLG